METSKRSKKDIRKEALKRRRDTDAFVKKEQENAFLDAFLSWIFFREIKRVYIYLDYHDELPTGRLIEEMWRHGIRTAVPKVVGKELEFYEITGWEQVSEGYKGILEPNENGRRARWSDALVVLPGAAFTENGDRLGYGGGYYDRFLEREGEHETVGICYDFQVMDSLPTEEHDKAVDFLATPSKITDIRRKRV